MRNTKNKKNGARRKISFVDAGEWLDKSGTGSAPESKQGMCDEGVKGRLISEVDGLLGVLHNDKIRKNSN